MKNEIGEEGIGRNRKQMRRKKKKGEKEEANLVRGTRQKGNNSLKAHILESHLNQVN